MQINTDLFTLTQWLGIGTVVSGAFTVLAFLLKWGFRFRLVGVTSFMGVLTGGVFALGLGLFTRTAIPGAVHYSLVYDTGSTQTVVAVAPEITQPQLEATLQQVAADLFSPGRMGYGNAQLTIRVRTIIHPEPGISQPVYLGEVKRALSKREDAQMVMQIFPENLALLPKSKA